MEMSGNTPNKTAFSLHPLGKKPEQSFYS